MSYYHYYYYYSLYYCILNDNNMIHAVIYSDALSLIDEANLRDFQLRKVGEVFSMFNLQRAQVKDKPADLDSAFTAGVRLATAR